MPVIRTHHYAVDPADLGRLLTRRAEVIAAIRAAHPGLAHTRLARAHPQAPATCLVVALSRLNRLVMPIIRIRAASPRSS